MFELRVSDTAALELDEAADWYADSDGGERLADRFLDEFDRVARTLVDHPYAWTETRPGVRRALLWGFPYSVFYRVASSRVLILAVVHQRREPGSWHE